MVATGAEGTRVGDGGQAAQSAASAWPVFATLGRVALVGARRVRIAFRSRVAPAGDVGRVGGSGSGMADRVDLRKVGIRRT